MAIWIETGFVTQIYLVRDWATGLDSKTVKGTVKGFGMVKYSEIMKDLKIAMDLQKD